MPTATASISKSPIRSSPSSNRAGCAGSSPGPARPRAYSGINILILWCAVAERGFTGQNWLTFRQALKLGAHVRKGENGTTVVYADRFAPYRERSRAAEAGDEPEAIPFLKRFTVFNADRCQDLHIRQNPCSINEIDFDRDDFTIIAINQTDHLSNGPPMPKG